ncbi:MAG: hypothetical protein AAF747_11865 [Planctomycetota bacterium]
MSKTPITTIGAIAAAPFATAASGQIVYTELGPVSGDLSGANAMGSIVLGIDFNQDTSTDMNIRRQINGAAKLYIDGDAGSSQGNNDEDEIITSSPGDLNPTPLLAGDIIDGTANFRFASNNNGGAADSDIWKADGSGSFPVDGVERFIGVRTVLDGNTVFGWIGIVLLSEDGNSINGFVSGHAYELSGGPIAAGAIPAPAGAATLALGGLALAGRRRVG